jgi:hypothetical protein
MCCSVLGCVFWATFLDLISPIVMLALSSVILRCQAVLQYMKRWFKYTTLFWDKQIILLISDRYFVSSFSG